MVVTCIVCKKQPIPGDNNRSFHKFPDDVKQKQKWMNAIGVSSVSKYTRICSDHFCSHSFHNTDGYTTIRRLLPDAVPSSTINRVLPDITNKQSMVKNPIESESVQHSEYTDSKESFVINKDQGQCINEPSIDESSNQSSNQIANRKRKLSEVAVEDINPNKKIRFMDGCQSINISKEDFVSDEAWKRFLKYHTYRVRQIQSYRKRNERFNQKIGSFKDLVETLREKNALSAANYLEV